ncbi:hypothetical protein EV426DRAFT_701743 [Tirmania nivea]|nr:hypothetical protein EV426DRAFT_701743 [Tirmania nivea]
MALNRVYPVRMNDVSLAEVLDVLLKVDVMNSLASNTPGWRDKSSHANHIESPLMTAFSMSDESAVLKLLQNGASSATSYQNYLTLRGMKPLLRNGYFGVGSTEVTKDTWVCYIKQPLERAIRKTLDVIQPLLEAGADLSTVLNESYNDKDRNRTNKRRTVLDLVRDNIKSLKLPSDNYLIPEPIQLGQEVDAGVYEQYPPDSYKRFYTHMTAKWYNTQLKTNNLAKLENHAKKQQGREALKKNIEAAISLFERAEKHLISKGVRSYYELYPEEEAVKATYQEQPYEAQWEYKVDETLWEGDFKFVVSNLDNDKKEAYLKLEKYRYTLDEEGTGIAKEAIIEDPPLTTWDSSHKLLNARFFLCASFILGFEDKWTQETLLSWTINNNKVGVIQTLLELARIAEDDGQWRLINPVLSCPTNRFDNLCNALRLGRISILETFIKATGCGLDYAALESVEHEKGMTKPERYLCLAMNGRKREDWAKSVNPNTESETAKEKLLHVAAHQGNIDSVHWLLSDRPLHSQPDLAKVVEDALGLDSEIFVHLTIQGWNGKGSVAVLDFWLSKFPELLEARCDDGLTPLLHAAHCKNDRAVKYMIAKGAELQATTNDGLNFVHIALGLKDHLSIYNPLSMKAVENAKRLLLCLPKDIDIEQMIAHRTMYMGELATIWHIFIDIKAFLPGVEYFLRISGGQGLDVFNRGGNLPIHHAITKGRFQLAKLYIEAKENASGKTPFELATDLFLGTILNQIGEPIPSTYNNCPDTKVEELIKAKGHLNHYGSFYQNRVQSPETEEDDYKYQGARIRVTLNEVNELVHRLANKGKQVKAKKAVGHLPWGRRQRGLYRRRWGKWGECDMETGLLQAWPIFLGGLDEEQEEGHGIVRGGVQDRKDEPQ